MFRGSLFNRLLFTYVILIVVSLAILTLVSISAFNRAHLAEVNQYLENTAHIAGVTVRDIPDNQRLQDRIKELGQTAHTRITIIGPDGTVIADSEKDPATMENHNHRPEVIQARTQGIGHSSRLSETLSVRMLYLAMPLSPERTSGEVIRVALPLRQVDLFSRQIYQVVIATFVFLVILAVLMGFWLVRAKYDQLRKDFVANVSHELRTPLALVKGYVETLKEENLDKQKTGEFLDIIDRNVRQLVNLVEDLLELSRLESNRSSRSIVRARPSNIAQIIERVAADFKPAILRKQHTTKIDIAAPMPEITTDPDLVEKAVGNLLDNAIKYTPDNGRIEIRAKLEAGELRIDVTDNGIGIPAQDLERVFERFYRVDKSRSREMGGTGLGLAIVKHIVHLHKGRVTVLSRTILGLLDRRSLSAQYSSSRHRSVGIKLPHYKITPDFKLAHLYQHLIQSL
ncbi:MAG: ATP-binding protein [Planctomycetes bacterium]|nr:ATP-binding protein [Planctomycetota bacterium]